MKKINLKTILQAIVIIAVSVIAIHYILQLPISSFLKGFIIGNFRRISFLIFLIPYGIYIGIKELMKKFKK